MSVVDEQTEAARLTCRMVLAAAGRNADILTDEPERVCVEPGVVTLDYGDDLFGWFPRVEQVAATVDFGGSLITRVFNAAGRQIGGYVWPAAEPRWN